MSNQRLYEEELWRAFNLGVRIADYMVFNSQNPTDINKLIEIIKDIDESRLTLQDPGESAKKCSASPKIAHSLSSNLIQVDKELIGKIRKGLISSCDTGA